MISMTFIKAPVGEPDEPCANFQPELAGEFGTDVDGERLTLSVYGEQDYGIGELNDKVIPFEGQRTYNQLRAYYLEKVGSVFARVTLRRAPNLSLEQTADGWCVLKMGGAEHPHFDGLVERLKARGFEATPVQGRSGRDAVAIQIPEGEEFEAFARLEPIIANSI